MMPRRRTWKFCRIYGFEDLLNTIRLGWRYYISSLKFTSNSSSRTSDDIIWEIKESAEFRPALTNIITSQPCILFYICFLLFHVDCHHSHGKPWGFNVLSYPPLPYSPKIRILTSCCLSQTVTMLRGKITHPTSKETGHGATFWAT